MSSNNLVVRSMLHKGINVQINPKDDRTRSVLISGEVAEILTGSETHPHGIMVRLADGQIGRVKSVLDVVPQIPQTQSPHTFNDSPLNIDFTNFPNISEGPFLEFKSSALWSKNYSNEDIERGNADLKRYGQDTSKVVIAKTLASFLNTDGGALIIGIKENKSDASNEIIGIQSEFRKLTDPCEDGYRRMILDYIIKPYFPSFIFNEFNKYLSIEFLNIDNKTLCIIRCMKSNKQVFLKVVREDLFYIRVDASTRLLSGRDLVEYCIGRFS